MPLSTSADEPLPVSKVSAMIGGWVDRLGAVWVEGQIVQLSPRPQAGMAFLTLRDPSQDASVTVTCFRRVFDAVSDVVGEGSRVVVYAKPVWFARNGSLSLRAAEIRPVGMGELLARLDRLRRALAAEGLFEAERKRSLPFLPHRIGLVTGRASDAERDVLHTARERWPAVRFEVRHAAVQGAYAVDQLVEAVRELDALPEVDVIIVTRGGGSMEDLLPFSDERLLRAVADCRTPVVSAIGHEADAPLLDLVADLRSRTPTHAAKDTVPDVGEEFQRVRDLGERARRAVGAMVDHERRALEEWAGRRVLAEPYVLVEGREAEVTELLGRSRRMLGHRLDRAADDLEHTRARVVALSPRATLRRGYAVLRDEDGAVVREAGEVDAGQTLRALVAEGEFRVTVAEGGRGAEGG
ncbi:exodeoxyribonuclease VII large subunit [Streptomyces sp. NPDC005438]|uniref:exodeoxyribonuclease VII large subunit n=1 Tax=Streptomyces sp. NPDC005438 TaxID=3156880 RepID=UPI0033B9FD12